MYTTLRPYATAGVAMLGASAIAIAPVVVAPAMPDLRVADPAVALSAAIDPLTPLLDLFNKSEVNFANLAGAWLEAPAPILQQIIANQIGYLGELPDIGAILRQMGTNVGAALGAPFAEDMSTLAPLHASIYDLILDGVPGAIEPAPPQLVPLLKFTTTYLSGALVGLAGLVMNPVLALGGSIHSVFQSLGGENADFAAALNTLINIPTTMVDAFLNGGQTMMVTPLLTALGLNLPIPGMEVELVFGGLLSGGGSMFNSLNIIFDPNNPAEVLPGQGAGFIGSLIGLTKAIAKAIGWDGEGNPLAPPLTTPAPSLRDAADTTVLAGHTITLETTDTVVADDAVTAAPAVTTGGDPEFVTVPVVSESADDETVEEEAVGDEPVEAAEPELEAGADEETVPGEEADEEAGDDADDAADDAADEKADEKADAGSDDAGSDSEGDSDSGSGSTGGSDAGE